LLTWEEVMHMKKQGVMFGSHGMRHAIMTKLSREEIDDELAESKMIIRRRTGIETEVFAYPNGLTGDFCVGTARALARNGYKAACTLVKGYNTEDTNIFELKRYCVSEGMGTNVFGQYSSTLFAVEMSGVYNRLLGRK